MGNYYQDNVDISGFASPFYDLARYTSAAINSKFTGMGLLTTKDTTVLSRYGSYSTNSVLGYAEAGVNYSFVSMDLHRPLTGPGSLSSCYYTLPLSGSWTNSLGYTAVIYLIIVGRGGDGGTDPTMDGLAGWSPFGAGAGGGSGYYNWMRIVLQPGDSVSYTATQDASGIVTLSITTTVAAGSLAYVQTSSSSVYRHEPGTVSRSVTAAAGNAGQVNAGGQGLCRGGDHNTPGGSLQAGTIAIDRTYVPDGAIPGGASATVVSGAPAGGGGGAPFCSAPMSAADGFQGGRGAYWTSAGDVYTAPAGVDATSGVGPGAGGGGNVNKYHNYGNYFYKAAAPGQNGGLYFYYMI